MNIDVTRSLFVLLLSCLLLLPETHAQNRRALVLSGTTVDASDNTPLPGVNITLTLASDTTRQRGVVSDEAGNFQFRIPEPAIYQLRFSFIGYKTVERQVDVSPRTRNLGTIRMEPDVLEIDQVTIEARQQRVVVKDDTTEYNADAYKVTADASAEDLVAKMPGIVVDNGSVQAQGEEVRRVLVDGREFFGNDATAALRNLPSEIIERIQVFDRMSDQAQLTGFDDGNSEKTINIITRTGRSNGQFGKVYGGYGSEERYIAGGNINIFDGNRRISIIGLSNNVNQQNFTNEDLLGVIGSAGRRRGGGGFGGGRRRGGGGLGGGGGGGIRFQRPAGRGGSRTDPSNFLVGNQSGVNTTTALGINYTDAWGDKMEVTGSYFFNMADNTTDALLDREYFLTDASSQFYNETNNASSDNANHRFTMRMEYTIDDNNSILFMPRFSSQSNEANSLINGLNTLDSATLLSQTTNEFFSDNAGFTSSTNLLFRHRLAKPGRTFSVNLGVGYDDRTGDSDLVSTNIFYDTDDPDELLDQRTDNTQDGLTLSSNFVYTEPIGRGQLQVNYRPSLSRSKADRKVNGLDATTGIYSILDPTLSNIFDNNTRTQRGGLTYRLRNGRQSMLSVGFQVQDVQLTGDQTFPTAFEVNRSFQRVLPNAMYMYRPSRTNNLRLFYRTSTNTPSIDQLQEVVDNTNPLQLSTGNPNLKQSLTHTFLARYNVTNVQKGQVFMGFLSVSTSDDYIGTESIIAAQNLELDNGVTLPQGAQYTRPVNLDGHWNMRSFFTFGLPASALKSNLNLNAGYTFSRTPGIINEALNESDVQNLNGGAVLGSNISERVDFTLSYAMNYNLVANSVYPELDADYTYQRASARLRWLPTSSLVLSTTVNYNTYDGLGDSVDETTVLWNASVGYKFLKGNGGEVNLAIADLLNQNTNINRTVSELYIEDNVSNVLGRYVMLNFIYTLRNFRI